jgi:hypothetical protein
MSLPFFVTLARREVAADAAAINVALKANPRAANELRKLIMYRGFSVCRRL